MRLDDTVDGCIPKGHELQVQEERGRREEQNR